MEISILVFIFGITVGSFLNVCIYRLPAEKSVVTPRSHCPHCDKLIVWYDNIPLFSYIMLGGKCRYCKTPIPFRYFFIELLTGLCFLLIHVMYKGPNFASICYIFVTACLIAITFIDFDHFIIPDVISYPGIIIGLFCSIVLVFFPQHRTPLIAEYSFVSAWAGKYAPIINSIAGLLVGGGILYIIAVVAKTIVKKDAMGGGDIKLLAFVGTFIGWKLILITLVFASFIGSVVGGIQLGYMRFKNNEMNLTGHYIPFGPYLALGTLFAILFGNPLIHWYLYKILMLDIPPGVRMP